ncbi:hypothetical protein NGUA15_03718 [Salmonella enterica]|nr:hypothetical protein NGUA15_03718 [Salmonella enterica]
MPSPLAMMVAPSMLTEDLALLMPISLELMTIELLLSPEIVTVEALPASMAAPLALSCMTVEFVISRTPLLDAITVLSVPVELTVLSLTFRKALPVVLPTTRSCPLVSVISLPSVMFSVLPSCETTSLPVSAVAVTLMSLNVACDSPLSVMMP